VALIAATLLATLILLGAALPRAALRGPFGVFAVHRLGLLAAGLVGLVTVIIGYFARGS
jgi:hypothetical protein